MDFDGKEYRRRRTAAGLTQSEVAEIGGFYQTDVSAYELGKMKPYRNYRKLALVDPWSRSIKPMRHDHGVS